MKKEITCRIKEHSIIARVAAAKLGSRQVAIVIGRTIHLHNTSAKDFLANSRWVRHEVAHVRQFRRYGFLPFLFKYVLESINKGYYNNKFEAEAREAEFDPHVIEGVFIKAPG